MMKPECEIKPCFCGCQPELFDSRTVTDPIEKIFHAGGWPYRLQCPKCGQAAYGWAKNKKMAIRFWNNTVSWKTICVDGKVCKGVVLTEDDKLQIQYVKEALRNSEALRGYCPEERERVFHKCSMVDINKYQIGSVAEHYGIAMWVLRKYRF
jgi:ribosomal protein L33